MNNTKRFYLASRRSTILDSLLEVASNNEPFERYYNFGMKGVDHRLICEDSFLISLHDAHPFKAAILLIPPNNIYNWHVDDNRGVAVNMMVSGRDSHCVFTDEDFDIVNGIEELRYEPETYYLFNTQKYHSVINLNNPRYMMSIEFNEDKYRLNYDQLVVEYERGDFG